MIEMENILRSGYKEITYKPRLIPANPLRSIWGFKDRWLDFSIEEYSRKAAVLKRRVSSFTEATRSFIEDIVGSNGYIKLDNDELKKIVEQFASYKADIELMIADIERKMVQHNITTISTRSLLTGMIIAFLAGVIIFINTIATPIHSHIGITYDIPDYVIDQKILFNITQANNASVRTNFVGNGVTRIVELDRYIYSKDVAVDPSFTQMRRKVYCTATPFSCAELNSRIGYFKIAMFAFMALWFVLFFAHVGLLYPKSSFLELRGDLIHLQKKCLRLKRFVNFITLLQKEERCRVEDEVSYYDAKIFSEPPYNPQYNPQYNQE